jgi:hypothetical protein
MIDKVEVVVVPDDNSLAPRHIPRNILTKLGRHDTLMSNDSRRMYVRETLWLQMQSAINHVNR